MIRKDCSIGQFHNYGLDVEEQCKYLGELFYSLRIVIGDLEYIEHIRINGLKIFHNIYEILLLEVTYPFADIYGHKSSVFGTETCSAADLFRHLVYLVKILLICGIFHKIIKHLNGAVEIKKIFLVVDKTGEKSHHIV